MKSYEPIMEMFIFETSQLLEQLEQIIIESEKQKEFSYDHIREIFRIMHTIKGSSSMMAFHEIAALSHSIEDLFFFIREKRPDFIQFAALTDLILKGADFIKTELSRISEGLETNTDSSILTDEIKKFLSALKEENSISNEAAKLDNDLATVNTQESIQVSTKYKDEKIFKAVIFFEDGCQMENIRAFAIVHNLNNIASDIAYFPQDIKTDSKTEEII